MRGILTGSLGGGDSALVLLRATDDVIVDIALPDAISGGATGTHASTLDAFTSVAVGVLSLVGAHASTLDAFTSTSVGRTSFVGVHASTLSAFTSVAVGNGGAPVVDEYAPQIILVATASTVTLDGYAPDYTLTATEPVPVVFSVYKREPLP